MKQHIGDVIKKIRTEKNLTKQDVANNCNYSIDYIYKVEKGVRKPSSTLLHLISIYLEFDFLTLNDKLSDFKNYTHYFLTHRMIDCINKKDFETLQEYLDYTVVKNEFIYEEPLIVKRYSTLLIETNVNKNFKKALSLCLDMLEINIEEISSFTPRLNQHNYYYGTLLSLTRCFNFSKEYEVLLNIQERFILFFENNYFNEVLSISSVKQYYKKLFIIMLNNYSDTFFNLGDYIQSLYYCEKAISKAIELEVFSILPAILKLKILNLYKLNKLSEAKNSLKTFHAFCDITKNIDYYNKTVRILKKDYSNIFNI